MLWCPGAHIIPLFTVYVCVCIDRPLCVRCTPASRWCKRASTRWIQQCKPLQWVFAPLLGATLTTQERFRTQYCLKGPLCCSRRQNAVFVASRIMSDFCHFVGFLTFCRISSDYEPYRWHLSDFNISMWLLIPAVFCGKLHFHWSGKQRMYDINSGRPVWLWAWLRSPPFS